MKQNAKKYKVVAIFVVAVSLVFTVAGVRGKMGDHIFHGKDRKLEAAIDADNGAAINQALKDGANVNAHGRHGITPLMMAVDGLKKAAVTELLRSGANPNEKAEDGTSAVSLAVENYRQAPEIFSTVMESGGDANIRRPDDDPVIMRFINDRNREYIQRMKDYGADLNIHTRSDDPVIISAALGVDWDVVWWLIELGAKYDYETTSHYPLSLCIADDVPFPDSPIYPYKKKVWHFLHDHGIKLQPLK